MSDKVIRFGLFGAKTISRPPCVISFSLAIALDCQPGFLAVCKVGIDLLAVSLQLVPVFSSGNCQLILGCWLIRFFD